MTTQRLSDLDVSRVDIVDRAAVRDPEHLDQPARFLLWKSENGTPSKENSMPNVVTKKLASALAKAAENESALDAFIAKDEVTPEMAAAIKGAFRLMSGAAVTPEAFEAMAKAAFPGAAKPFGSKPDDETDKKDKAAPAADDTHAFKGDGKVCAMDGCDAGPKAAIHLVGNAGASGSKTIEATAKVGNNGASGSKTVEATEKADYSPAPYKENVDESVVCPACGKKDESDAVFCDQCGVNLKVAFGALSEDEGAAPAAAEAKAPPAGTAAPAPAAAAKAEVEPTEEIVKSELAKLPAAVRAAVEKAMETAKAETARADAAEKEAVEKKEQIAKSEVVGIVKDEMGHIPGTNEEALVELLYNLRKSDAATFDALRPLLKSASEAVGTSDLLKTKGSEQSGNTGSPVAQVAEIAKGIAKAEGMTLQKAKAEAWKRNPELFRTYQAEQAARS